MAKLKCTYKVEEWKEEVSETLSSTSKIAAVRAFGPVGGILLGRSTRFISWRM